MYKEKAEKMTPIEKGQWLIIIGLFLPMFFIAYFTPTLITYFMSKIGRDAYATVELTKQIFACIVLGSACFKVGKEFFIRHFYKLIVIDLIIAIVIAAAADQILIKFYGDVLQMGIVSKGLGQTLNAYIPRVTIKENQSEFYNRIGFSGTIGALTGAFISSIWCPFTVDELLVGNVFTSLIVSTFYIVVVKYIDKNIK